MRTFLLVSVTLGALGLKAQDPTSAQILGEGYRERALPVLESWCFTCHEGDEPAGALDLDGFPGNRGGIDTLHALRRIRDRVRSGEMPPPDPEDPIDDDDRKALLAWIDASMAEHLPGVRASAGRVTVRRLSRFEYRNTVRDLFGVATARTAAFPQDDLSYGFDNIGDAVTFSTLHLEKYQDAAADIARQVAFDGDPEAVPVREVRAEDADWQEGRAGVAGDFVNLFSRGSVGTRFELDRKGTYRITLRAAGTRGDKVWPNMDVEVDGRRVDGFEVDAPRSKPKEFQFEVELTAGRPKVEAVFTNDYYNPRLPKEDRDRNLLVEWIRVEGPLEPWHPPEAAEWLHARDSGKGRAKHRGRRMVTELLRRAWRRPPSKGEITRWCDLVQRVAEIDGSTFGAGIQAAVEAALTSPYFLFRIEPDGRSEDLDGYALASRLSYFLWSSAPDDVLLKAARRLRDPAVFDAQVERMLADEKASALAVNFAGQWLELKSLGAAQPDPDRFPADPALMASMARETEALFEHVLRQKRPVRELMTADYTFVNERLARHYGIDGVRGSELRRVSVPAERRAGVLGHASVLTVTSNPTRTSPVKRGKWILENILGAAPPPPPPGADSLASEEDAVATSKGLRAQMAAHRASAKCAVCHVRMDAFGLALENFDAVGRFRDRDQGGEIDASGALPDGSEVRGVGELRDALLRERDFERNVLHKLFVYAVGRPAEPADDLVMEGILMRLPQGVTLHALIQQVVAMEPFRRRSSR